MPILLVRALKSIPLLPMFHPALTFYNASHIPGYFASSSNLLTTFTLEENLEDTF